LYAGNTKNDNSEGSPYPGGSINGLATIDAAGAGIVSHGAPSYDYHIQGTCAAKDGALGSTTDIDIDGQPRPYNGVCDYGADEYWPSRVLAGGSNVFLAFVEK
jgi:hypothetical protein